MASVASTGSIRLPKSRKHKNTAMFFSYSPLREFKFPFIVLLKRGVIARRANARRGALSAEREEVLLGCNPLTFWSSFSYIFLLTGGFPRRLRLLGMTCCFFCLRLTERSTPIDFLHYNIASEICQQTPPCIVFRKCSKIVYKLPLDFFSTLVYSVLSTQRC